MEYNLRLDSVDFAQYKIELPVWIIMIMFIKIANGLCCE